MGSLACLLVLQMEILVLGLDQLEALVPNVPVVPVLHIWHADDRALQLAPVGEDEHILG